MSANIDQLMAEIFDKPRTPRSDAYKAGVRAVLHFRLIGKARGEHVRCPYRLGTAEADAFFGGVAEGHTKEIDFLKRFSGREPGRDASIGPSTGEPA